MWLGCKCTCSWSSSHLTFLLGSGKTHDDTLIAKLECVYTGSGDRGSSMVSHLELLYNFFIYFLCGPSYFLSVQFVFNVEQGLPVLPEWLFFNRVTARVRKGVEVGPARILLRYVCLSFSLLLLFLLFLCVLEIWSVNLKGIIQRMISIG